jgi:hypothetical protein
MFGLSLHRRTNDKLREHGPLSFDDFLTGDDDDDDEDGADFPNVNFVLQYERLNDDLELLLRLLGVASTVPLVRAPVLRDKHVPLET